VRVLAVTNMLPTETNVRAGTFVKQQISSLQGQGVEVQTLHLDRPGKGMSVYRHTALRLQRAIGCWHPEVIHTMYGGLMGWIVSRTVTDEALVQSFCGTDLQGAKAGSILLRVRAGIGVVLSRRTVRRVDHVIVKSKRLQARLPRWFPSDRVSLVPNGVDLDRFKPMDRAACRLSLGWREGVFHVLIAAPVNVNANKRVSLARAAVKQLEDSGVPAELHVMTSTPHAEVPIWLNAADAVLLTSVQEGSPNIVKEALSCNRPVVAVDAGDVAERIAGVAGCYVVLPSPSALARGLAAVRSGPGAVEGRASMLELSTERVATRLLAVYERAMQHRAASLHQRTTRGGVPR